MNNRKINNKRLLLRPFPQGIIDDKTRKELWSKYRKDMISQSGVSIFLFGNKKEKDKVILANGMQEEYEISKENKNILIPIGATGYVAEEIYNLLNKDELEYYGDKKSEIENLFKTLNNRNLDETLIENILQIINKLNN